MLAFLPLVFMIGMGLFVLSPRAMDWFAFLMCDVVAFVGSVLMVAFRRVKSFVVAVKSSINGVR